MFIQPLGAQARVVPRPIMSLAANATLGWYGNWNGQIIRCSDNQLSCKYMFMCIIDCMFPRAPQQPLPTHISVLIIMQTVIVTIDNDSNSIGTNNKATNNDNDNNNDDDANNTNNDN